MLITSTMTAKIFDTIIVGAGISGLACAKRLQEYDEDFLLISENIGGRILTSEDGAVNYGAFFVCSDYYHVLPYVTLHSRYSITLIRGYDVYKSVDSSRTFTKIVNLRGRCVKSYTLI